MLFDRTPFTPSEATIPRTRRSYAVCEIDEPITISVPAEGFWHLYFELVNTRYPHTPVNQAIVAKGNDMIKGYKTHADR